MTEIRFYQVTATTVDKALPRLLERIYSTSKRVLLLCATPERMKLLDTILWTFSSKVFLPHGTPADFYPEEQPLLVTTTPDNRNQAEVVVLDQGMTLPADLTIALAVDMFDGTNPAENEAAEQRAAHYRAQGHSIVWWQQDHMGKWHTPAVTV